MARYRLNMALAREKSRTTAKELEIGGTYFLSSFYEKDGAWVKVLSVDAKAKWPSATIEVLEPLGRDLEHVQWAIDRNLGPTFFSPGKVHSVNPTNLYKNRDDASHAAKFGPDSKAASIKIMSALTGLDTKQIEDIRDGKPLKLTPAQKAWQTRRARQA